MLAFRCHIKQHYTCNIKKVILIFVEVGRKRYFSVHCFANLTYHNEFFKHELLQTYKFPRSTYFRAFHSRPQMRGRL